MFRASLSRALFVFLSLVVARSGAADEAIRGFVSVEPFELRIEALVRVEAFRESWRMEVDSIGPAEKLGVIDNLLILFRSGLNLKVPDETIVFTEHTARFVVPDPEKGYVTDERAEIPLAEALVGLTLSATVHGVSAMDLEWLWFAPKQERLVIEIASRGKPSARVITPTENKIDWKIDGTTTLPSLLEIPAVKRVESRPARYLLIPGFAMLIYAGVIVVRQKTKSPSWVTWLIVGGVGVSVLSLKLRHSRVDPPQGEAVEDLVYALLRNTYHAFDFRDESAIYDTLEMSVRGPLLEEVYLEMRSSLELEDAGGPRVRVHEIALRECRETGANSDSRGGIETEAEWVTIGEVTHWGHTHERTNRYEAEVAVSPDGGRWKISRLELLNEERDQKISRRSADPDS